MLGVCELLGWLPHLVCVINCVGLRGWRWIFKNKVTKVHRRLFLLRAIWGFLKRSIWGFRESILRSFLFSGKYWQPKSSFPNKLLSLFPHFFYFYASSVWGSVLVSGWIQSCILLFFHQHYSYLCCLDSVAYHNLPASKSCFMEMITNYKLMRFINTSKNEGGGGG